MGGSLENDWISGGLRVGLITIWSLVLIGCGSQGSTNEESSAPDVEADDGLETDTVVSDYTFTLTEVNLPEGTKRSYRGMHVLSPDEVWLGGSGSTVLHTTDGGETWRVDSIAEAGSTQFRDIVAFDSQTAVTMSIASPGYIFKTMDGGETWNKVYENHDSLFFLDGMEFWNNQEGIAIGDPIDDYIFFLATDDGGDSWYRINTDDIPKKLPVENAFAASGTSLAVSGDGQVWAGLGGEKARVYRSSVFGTAWQTIETPIVHGNASKGVYSITFLDDLNGVAVGGNWEEHYSDSVAAWTEDGGATWILVEGESPDGYRSCVAVAGGECEAIPETFVTCGTTGTDVSFDMGRTWTKADTTNLNVIEFSPGSNLGWAANSRGQVFKVELKLIQE